MREYGFPSYEYTGYGFSKTFLLCVVKKKKKTGASVSGENIFYFRDLFIRNERSVSERLQAFFFLRRTRPLPPPARRNNNDDVNQFQDPQTGGRSGFWHEFCAIDFPLRAVSFPSQTTIIIKIIMTTTMTIRPFSCALHCV